MTAYLVNLSTAHGQIAPTNQLQPNAKVVSTWNPILVKIAQIYLPIV
jgi:hypothetical protein